MTVDWKKKLIPNLPYLLFVYLFDKLCQAVRLAPGLDASEKFLHLSQGFTEAFSSGLPSLHPLDLLAGIAGAVIVRLAVYAKSKNTKKYRKGIEYGSARWGTAADIAPYVDPVPDWNIPLTQTEKLTMSSRPKNPKYARNKNILVIGGSGSGKTRFFVKPSLMQMHSSYVVTDPKGQLLSEVGTMLRRGAPKLDENGKPLRDARGKVIYEPYRIKVLNTINFKKSMKYNPFAYIRSEKDILKLVNVIIANTKGDGEKSSEDFWVKAERLLYCALIGYIWYEAGPEEKNFLTLLELINASEAREDDEEFQSPVDILFAKLEKEHPDHFAVKQYRKFKLAAGKTLKTGGYMTASLLEQAAEKPEILLAFADQLLAEHEKNRQLSGEVERLRPKADFYDAFVHEENCTNIRATAKELQIGERAFCRFLMDAGFLYRCPAGYLLPYAKPSNNGLFRVKDFWKYGHFGQQTLITPQGKNVIRLLLDDGQMRLEWKERMG